MNATHFYSFAGILLILFSDASCSPNTIEHDSQVPSAREVEQQNLPIDSEMETSEGETSTVGSDGNELITRTVRAFNDVSSYTTHAEMNTPEKSYLISDCLFTSKDTYWCSAVAASETSAEGGQTDIFFFEDHYWLKNTETKDKWLFVHPEAMEEGYRGPNSLDLVDDVGEISESTLFSSLSYRVELDYNAKLIYEYLTVNGQDNSTDLDSADDLNAEGILWVDAKTYLPVQEEITVTSRDAGNSEPLQFRMAYRNFNEGIEFPFIPLEEALYSLAQDFMEAMRHGDYQEAQEFFSTRAQVNEPELESLAQSRPMLFAEYEVADLVLIEEGEIGGATGPFQILTLEVEKENRSKLIVRFLVEKELGDWKLFRFEYQE